MINVKLLVLFVCVGNIECFGDYCKICTSHTLCMYKNPGPGPLCKSYDKTASITKNDVETIVNKINQRRNFVALGLARNLPSAANMNEMRWSDELAMFAQRWADQCDPAVRPEKTDLCRDLVDTKVGQNIATVTGLSPGLSVKSFIEMWYMQALEYSGSVTYYNESRESKTNYFTQLIWAETTLVGCGKARFSIDDKGTMVDRFVCNFAPRGNVRGKPVYTIGYPATQCKENCKKDEKFTGLCKFVPKKAQKTTMVQTESNWLRLINLPTNPVKQDIDPIKIDYKSREMTQDVLNLIRHQNLRHIPNKTRGFIHHISPVKLNNKPGMQNTPSRHDVILRQHTIDNSQNIHDTIYKSRSPIEHYRKNDYIQETIDPYYYYGANVRRRTFSGQCTRKSPLTESNNESNIGSQIEADLCTRGKTGNEYILTTEPYYKKIENRESTMMHAWNSQKFTCLPNPTVSPYNCNFNCHCFNINNPDSENHRKIPGEYVYYDYFPSLALRSGDEFEAKHFMKPFSNAIQITTSLPQNQNGKDPGNDYFTHELKSLGLSDEKLHWQSKSRKHFQNRNYPSYVYHGERPKRQIGKQFSDMSFWKVDESNKPSQKRIPRYTTLLNKIKRKFRTTFGAKGTDTESITISTDHLKKHRHDNTDKSLSFEELMYFRKNRGGELDMAQTPNVLRNGDNKTTTTTKKAPATKNTNAKTTTKTTTTKATVKTNTKITTKTATKTTTKTTAKTTAQTTVKTTGKTLAAKASRNRRIKLKNDVKILREDSTTTETTTLMTIIGSFSPQSACTRKITCTWTMAKATDANGKEILYNGGGGSGGGGGGDWGGGGGFADGRTPWGHVENCTRRYTCSRLYYNRNVQASDTADAGETTLPDEDYCERRALNIKRRDSYGTATVQTNEPNDHFFEITPPVTPSMKLENTAEDNVDCFCDDQKQREKRSLPCKHEKKYQELVSKKKTTPDNFYFLALGKLLQIWEINRNKHKNHRSGCHCNKSVPTHKYNHNLFIFIYFYMYILK